MASAVPLHAQRTYDAVYLKDSTVIYGSIESMDTDKEIRIMGTDKRLYVVDMSRVDRILRQPGTGIPITKPPFREKSGKGYYNEWEMGLNMGMALQNWWGWSTYRFVASFTLGIVNGYQWNRYLRTGVGLGIDVFDRVPFSPVFLRAGGNLFNGPASLLYYGEFGHSFSWEDTNQKGGLMYGIGTGIRFNSRGSAAFHITFGYRIQRSTWQFTGVDWNGMPVHDEEKMQRNRLALRLGFSF